MPQHIANLHAETKKTIHNSSQFEIMFDVEKMIANILTKSEALTFSTTLTGRLAEFD